MLAPLSETSDGQLIPEPQPCSSSIIKVTTTVSNANSGFSSSLFNFTTDQLSVPYQPIETPQASDSEEENIAPKQSRHYRLRRLLDPDEVNDIKRACLRTS